MSSDTEECLNAVNELNDMLYNDMGDSLLDDEYGEYKFLYHSTGYSQSISFNHEYIYDSDNDEREWNEATCKYEPLVQYIIKKMNEYTTTVNKVNDALNKN